MVTWKLINPVCLQSDCGTYTVAKYATPTGWKYQAFKGRQFLRIADSAAECKQACEVECEQVQTDQV